jgi:hypothetical protein
MNIWIFKVSGMGGLVMPPAIKHDLVGVAVELLSWLTADRLMISGTPAAGLRCGLRYQAPGRFQDGY